VARRCLALFCAVALALKAPRGKILEHLKNEEVSEALSPAERSFLRKAKPSRREIINYSWHSERLTVLLWALRKIDSMPGFGTQCDTRVFTELLPPYASIDVTEFIRTAQLRSDEELIDLADTVLEAHWQARDASIHKRPAPSGIDLEVVQERHHAINWIIGYDGLDWDDVTTDT
jgi:hypothetical protein